MMKSILNIICLLSILLAASVSDVAAEIPARLRRIDIRPHAAYTRLVFQLDRETVHDIKELPNQRFRVTFSSADGPRFRRLRDYSDQRLNGIAVLQRGDSLQVVIGLKGPGEGVRVIDGDSHMLTLDVGPSFRAEQKPSQVLEGREPIAAGAGRFVKEYDPALKSELSLVPTDPKALRELLNEQDTRIFLAGEAALYKGYAAEALKYLEPFLKSDSRIWALAAYRCAEAYYNLQDHKRALELFREAEKLWPQFLSSSPAVVFCYADSLIRCGDLLAGRKVLAALIASQAEKKSAPILLVRLADILARQQREIEAQLIYKNVVQYFPDNKAAAYAALKLADRRFQDADINSYAKLRDEYREIAKKSSDFKVREEALFKAALLESLFGPGIEALQAVASHERHYPRGIFAAITHAMHEELMVPVYRDVMAARDNEGLIKVAEENLPYLSRVMAEPEFIKDLDRSYTGLGFLQDEVRFFSRLVRREWAAQHAPFIYGKMLDKSLSLADWAKAESSGREFLLRFPSHAESQRAREILGDISYRKGDMAGVRADLAWLLLDSKARASSPESYYYLGKAFEEGAQPKLAGRSMELFLAALKERQVSSPLAADAHFTAGMSQLASGNANMALATFRSGLVLAPAEGRDRFLYRIGEICLREGHSADAKSNWTRIVKDGNDPVWQKLATQAIADLDWKERTGSKI